MYAVYSTVCVFVSVSNLEKERERERESVCAQNFSKVHPMNLGALAGGLQLIINNSELCYDVTSNNSILKLYFILLCICSTHEIL
jgi:hypothetical protein